MITTSFNKFAEYYDEVMGTNGDYTHQHTIDPALLTAVGEIKGKKIYDIGCGNGYLANKLIKKGAMEVCASDISEKLIAIAKQRYSEVGIKFFIENGSDFSDIPDKFFDIVIMNMAIHYIDDIDRLFEGVNKVLKRNGIFAFTIDHPLKALSHFDTGRIAPFEKVVETAQKYLESGKRTVFNHWTQRKDLHIFKRPLSEYVTAMSKNGLYISKIVEPKTDALASYQTWETVQSNIPTVMAIQAQKLSN